MTSDNKNVHMSWLLSSLPSNQRCPWCGACLEKFSIPEVHDYVIQHIAPDLLGYDISLKVKSLPLFGDFQPTQAPVALCFHY